MLRFEDDDARRLEAIYTSPDVVAQRQWTRKSLALSPGEAVLDIGSGPGFLAAEMASEVGQSGRISGVDISDTMLAMAQERSSRLGLGARVDFHLGEATKLPFPDESFDAAVSTQVYEYVADIDRALAEVRRVLRPGGRVLVVDTDWDSLVWHGADRDLSARILKAWEDHLVDGHLPGTLSLRLQRGGFEMQHCDAYTMLNPSYEPDTFSFGLIGLINAFVPGRQGLTSEDVARWSEELRRSGETGGYFFSLNRYLFLAVRQPG